VNPSSRSRSRPVVRLDADGNRTPVSNWESLTERLIREAQEAGRFEDLPGHGRPLHLDDDTYAGDMALAYHILRNAGVAPPWIEADKEVRTLRADIDAVLVAASRAAPLASDRLRRRLEELVDRHDQAIARLNSLAPTPRQQRRRIDRRDLMARLEQALAQRTMP